MYVQLVNSHNLFPQFTIDSCCKDCDCSTCQTDINTYAFPKRKIIKDMDTLLKIFGKFDRYNKNIKKLQFDMTEMHDMADIQGIQSELDNLVDDRDKEIMIHGPPREYKINVFRDMCKYLTSNHCLKYIKNYPTFEKVMRNKLIDFYTQGSFEEANFWYVSIFREKFEYV